MCQGYSTQLRYFVRQLCEAIALPGLRFVRQGIHLRLRNRKLREECGSHFDVSLHKDDSSFPAGKCPAVILTESKQSLG